MANTATPIALSIVLHRPTLRRRADQSAYEVDADKAVLHLAKDILESPEYQAITGMDQRFRTWLQDRALPSHFRRGVYLVPPALLADIDEAIEAFRVKRTEAVESFLAVYPAQREAARATLRALYDEDDYPAVSQLRRAFRVESAYLSLDTPGSLKAIDSALYKRERERAAARWEETLAEIRDALRAAAAEVVTHLAKRLTPSEDGKRKRLHESAVTKAQEFCKLFAARNLTGDGELEALIEQAQALLSGVDVATLRDAPDYRKTIQVQTAQIGEAIQALATRSRKITLDDEEVAA